MRGRRERGKEMVDLQGKTLKERGNKKKSNRTLKGNRTQLTFQILKLMFLQKYFKLFKIDICHESSILSIRDRFSLLYLDMSSRKLFFVLLRRSTISG